MGYALSWIAFKGKDAASVLRQLQFEETPQKEEFPESDLTAIQIGDWYIIVGNRDWVVPLSKINFWPMSFRCELVFCNVEEHVMFSYVTWWKDGKRKYMGIHNASSGLSHLSEEGEFAQQFNVIRDELIAKQKNEDIKGCESVDFIFDIPVEKAYSLVGYRHDQMVGSPDNLFTVLRYNPVKARFGSARWWKRLLFYEFENR